MKSVPRRSPNSSSICSELEKHQLQSDDRTLESLGGCRSGPTRSCKDEPTPLTDPVPHVLAFPSLAMGARPTPPRRAGAGPGRAPLISRDRIR